MYIVIKDSLPFIICLYFPERKLRMKTKAVVPLNMNITGIILAGGKSQRMGTDKALVKFEGKTLLQRALDFCLNFCNRVIISSGSVSHQIPGFDRIADEVNDCGPLGGIYSCVKQSSTDWNFVLSVDAVLVNMDLIRYLSRHLQEFDAIVPVHSRGIEPLMAFYHKRSLQVMESMLVKGKFKMQELLENIRTCYASTDHLTDNFPLLFLNLNNAEDLHRITQGLFSQKNDKK